MAVDALTVDALTVDALTVAVDRWTVDTLLVAVDTMTVDALTVAVDTLTVDTLTLAVDTLKLLAFAPYPFDSIHNLAAGGLALELLHLDDLAAAFGYMRDSPEGLVADETRYYS